MDVRSVDKAGVHPSAAGWDMLVEQLPPWDPEGGGLDQGVHFPDPILIPDIPDGLSLNPHSVPCRPQWQIVRKQRDKGGTKSC